MDFVEVIQLGSKPINQLCGVDRMTNCDIKAFRRKKMPNGYWHCKQNVIAEAQKYTTRTSFLKGNRAAYESAKSMAIIDDLFAPRDRSTPWKWSYENIKIEALKYKSRGQFAKSSPSAYSASRKNGYLDRICAHMIERGSAYNKMVYILISESYSYVGITCNYEKRIKEHKESSRMNGEKFTSFAHTDYMDRIQAAGLEKKLILYFRSIEEIKCLNISDGGEVGGELKSTKSSAMKAAKKCKTFKEFYINYRSKYDLAIRSGFIDEIREILKPSKKPNSYWSLDTCVNAARKCKTRKQFYEEFGSAYAFLRKIKSLHVLNEILPLAKKRNGYWTDERLALTAKKYQRKIDFLNSERSAYSIAAKKKIIANICGHMED